jgi:hypothetical protein
MGRKREGQSRIRYIHETLGKCLVCDIAKVTGVRRVQSSSLYLLIKSGAQCDSWNIERVISRSLYP